MTATFDHLQNQLTIRNHATSIQHVLAVPALSSLFSLPPSPSHTLLIGITEDSSIVQIHIPSGSATLSSPVLYSNTSLPLPAPPRFILPVDSMAWGSHAPSTQHDVLVSISTEGELAFWIPVPETSTTLESDRGKWQCTGLVHTSRKDIRMARCSSAKKTVLGRLKSWFSSLLRSSNLYFSCTTS
jgi:rabconnectin-3a